MTATKTPWTPTEVAALRATYPNTTSGDIARQLGRTQKQVYAKAYLLGLKKSPAFLASQASGRIQRARQDPRMVATQFKPGHTTWNKGKPGSTGLHENCRATQFKPGRAPSEAPNYAPIGSHRINKDGYLERKTNDTHPSAPRRWTAVHRLVWEAAHGPIPDGHIVVFKPGCRSAEAANITADRLECITRAEHAWRNHPVNKSPELARLVQLKGCITRQVNRINREAQEQTA